MVKVTKTITREITGCINQCPYFETTGMERMMECTHPHWKSFKDPYAGCIISYREVNKKHPFPKKCPLFL